MKISVKFPRLLACIYRKRLLFRSHLRSSRWVHIRIVQRLKLFRFSHAYATKFELFRNSISSLVPSASATSIKSCRPRSNIAKKHVFMGGISVFACLVQKNELNVAAVGKRGLFWIFASYLRSCCSASWRLFFVPSISLQSTWFDWILFQHVDYLSFSRAQCFISGSPLVGRCWKKCMQGLHCVIPMTLVYATTLVESKVVKVCEKERSQIYRDIVLSGNVTSFGC